jgi:quercetin 2,3-dioxygenase
VRIRQDVRLFASIVGGASRVTHALARGRKAWLHVVKGSAELNGRALSAGDGVAIEDETEITLSSKDEGEILLFDMAG